MTAFLLWQFLWLPLILLAVYPLAIQYERGGKWRALLPLYLAAAALDVLLNHTILALYTWDFPVQGEWTFSTRLRRLQYRTDWRRRFAVVLKPYLNFWQKGHI